MEANFIYFSQDIKILAQPNLNLFANFYYL